MHTVSHIFGPVPSRRLGISLGVDIIPFKTCTYNCIYCECGKTNYLTVERAGFVSPEIVLKEVEAALSAHTHLDYITFSGSGEPTLNQDIGKIIRGIKEISDVPLAVLTNGSLLYRADVRQELSPADVVLPSLDAASAEVFTRINQPHRALDIRQIIEGLVDFRRLFSREIWLEVLIVEGVNDGDEELDRLHRSLIKINPDKVQLNSLDRPPAYENVKPVGIETLERIVQKWPDLPVEIIKRIKKREEIAAFNQNLENCILNTIIRRPLTIDDLVVLTGKNRLELFKYIDVLEKEKKIHPKIVGKQIFFAPAQK
jgi:wyosine [tRNA(Phe)-imidazoG37] synthetase (radical SAM superfamily)